MDLTDSLHDVIRKCETSPEEKRTKKSISPKEEHKSKNFLLFAEKAGLLLKEAQTVLEFYNDIKSNQTKIESKRIASSNVKGISNSLQVRKIHLEGLMKWSLCVDSLETALKQMKGVHGIIQTQEELKPGNLSEFQKGVIDFLTIIITELDTLRRSELKKSRERLLKTKETISLTNHDTQSTVRYRGKNMANAVSNFTDENFNSCNNEVNGLDQAQIQINSQYMGEDNISAYEEIAIRINEIERLNSIVSSQLQAQHEVICSIGEQTQDANAALSLGNDHLRKTMQNRSSTRFWIVLIVIILDFSLLFLHWYN